MFKMELHNQEYFFSHNKPKLTPILNFSSALQISSTAAHFYYDTLYSLASQFQKDSSTISHLNQKQLPVCKEQNLLESLKKNQIQPETNCQEFKWPTFLQILIVKLILYFREYIVIQHVININRVNSLKRKISFTTFLGILFSCFVPSVSGSISCGFTNCAACDGFACTHCDDNFAWNVTGTACAPCKDAYCKTCTNPFSYNTCDMCIDNYYVNPSRGCTPCSIPQCLTCAFISGSPQCTSCDPGYGLDSGANCVTCSSMVTHCSSCTANATCTSCDSGYALASASGFLTCETCISLGLVGCTQCSDSSTCTQCFTSQYFLRAGDSHCSLCVSSLFLPNCYICEYSEAYCQTCILNYMISNSTNHCQPCGSAVNNCVTCNTSACLGCAVGWALSGGVCMPCTSIDTNCTACLPAACTVCAVGFFVSSPSCTLCSSAIPNCTDCSSSTACSNCTDGNAAAWNGTAFACAPCMTLMSNCTSCQVNGTCLACDYSNVSYLNNTTNLCNSCVLSLANCSTCQTSSACDICVNDHYALSNTFECRTCETFMSGCLTCSSSTICTSCVSSLFFRNTTDSVCYYCNSTQFQCRECIFLPSLTIQCTKCQVGLHLDTNYTCICDVGKAIDRVCIDVLGCISAIPGPICTGCQAWMVLRNGRCFCQADYWFVTDQCTNIVGCVAVRRIAQVNTCLFCDLTLNFALGVDGLCHCKTYYEMVDGVCSQICGDGVLVNSPCDDGNTVSGDGCSSKCALQSGFKCSVQNKTSKCVYTLKLTITLIKIEKIENFNSGRFIFEFKPAIATLNSMNWTNYVNVSVPGANFTITGSLYKSGKLYVNFNFGSSIQGLMAEMSINFDPSLFSISGYNFTFPIVSDSARFTYSTKLETYKLMEYIFLALGGLTLLIFVASLPFHKMLGVETLQVFQIFFISLLIIDRYEQVYNKLNVLGYTLGFAKFWKYDDDVALNSKLLYSRLGVVRQFVQNQVLILPIIILTSSIFFVYFIQYSLKTQQRQKLSSYLESLMLQSSKWYRWLTFPIVIGFSYGSFLALYSQTSSTKQWKSETYKEESNIISVQANLGLILAFYFIYSYTFWAEVLIPHRSQISKALLSVERAKKWYVSQYLAYCFVLMNLLLGGYQNSSCMALFLLSFIVTVQLLIVVFARPYYEGIHTIGIIINQATLTVSCLSLFVRQIKVQYQGQLYTEDDNFYLVILLMVLLAVVDGVSIARLVSSIRVKFKVSEKCTKSAREQDMRDAIRKSFISEVKQLSFPMSSNKYLVDHQIMQSKKDIWKEMQKKRVLNGMEELQQN